ncbi:MAG: adenosylmethionine decarboxylase [Sporomusaceae bacterium]|nr:adenosylmethionine decarboxylase [Sporomusaceae bacterium]
MKSIGRHITADFYGCSFKDLNSIEFIQTAVLAALKNANLTLLDFSHKTFEPQGLTVLALLAGSHMTVHTYPDRGFAAIDIYTCEEQSRPDRAIQTMKEYLHPDKLKTTNIKRGDFGSERDMKPKIKVSITPFRRVRSTGAKVLSIFSRVK